MNYTENHLTPEEIAICADAINAKQFSEIDEKFRKHLIECDQCSSDVLMVADVAFDFHNHNQNMKKRAGYTRIRQIVYPVIAAAAIIIFTMIVFPDLLTNSRDQSLTGQQPDKPFIQNNTVPADTSAAEVNYNTAERNNGLNNVAGNNYHSPTESIANDYPGDKDPQSNGSDPVILAQFQPHPDLEKLVERYDSNLRSDNHFKMISENRIAGKSGDSLKWSKSEEKSLIIELLDNDNERVKMQTTDNNYLVIPDLDQGVYYWKVIDAESYDLLHAGKILIQ